MSASTQKMKQPTLGFQHTRRGAATASKKQAVTKVQAPPPQQVKQTPKPRKQRFHDDSSEAESTAPSSVSDYEDNVSVTSVKKENDSPRTKVQSTSKSTEHAHVEKESKAEKILRTFDVSYDYGPCIGFTRMERWERAEAMGLNPPTEVREILLSQDGQDKYSNNIFHNRV